MDVCSYCRQPCIVFQTANDKPWSVQHGDNPEYRSPEFPPFKTQEEFNSILRLYDKWLAEVHERMRSDDPGDR